MDVVVANCKLAERGAQWIWGHRDDYTAYNDSVIIKKAFALKSYQKVEFNCAVDSYYRLEVNGQWVGDGPARSWDDYLSVDSRDITAYCHPGENEILLWCRYYGCGTFRGVHLHAGLIGELLLTASDGREEYLPTSTDWLVSSERILLSNVPKVSIQMEPFEIYSAWQVEDTEWLPAALVPEKYTRSRRGFYQRRVAFPVATDHPCIGFAKLYGGRTFDKVYSLAHVRRMYGNVLEGDGRVYAPFGLAAVIRVDQATAFTIQHPQLDRGVVQFSLNGLLLSTEAVVVEPGEYLLIGFSRNIVCNDKQITFAIDADKPWTAHNPYNTLETDTWLYLPFRQYGFQQDDLIWRSFANELDGGKEKAFDKVSQHWLEAVTSVDAIASLPATVSVFSEAELFDCDPYLAYQLSYLDQPQALEFVEPEGNLYDLDLEPFAAVDLIFDFGEQVCGYYRFSFQSDDAGGCIDFCSLEYITPEGVMQFPERNRNGMRYRAKKGQNHYQSCKRRSGRYVVVRFEGFSRLPVDFSFDCVETHYPAKQAGDFNCSNQNLNEIFALARRSLRLCTEDVYTDCPLYEQTLWVGDLRHEALIGYYLNGETEIARNSLLLAAESLTRYEIVSAQAPTCWKVLVPAFSFLWCQSVWEYYWYTADKSLLEVLYQPMRSNLQAAAARLNDEGLFAGPFWNFFDWVKMDQDHETYLINSQLMVAALQAFIKVSDTLAIRDDKEWALQLLQKLTAGIDSAWDASHDGYRDAPQAEAASASYSRHTSVLAFLYDIVPLSRRKAVLDNCLNQRKDLVEFGSPFALMFLYEALDKADSPEKIISDLIEKYLPMLESGATTGWESFPSGSLSNALFPTRSHCHGWAAIPIYFFQRVILGLRPIAAGCRVFELCPCALNLDWASGSVATPHGLVEVSWRRQGDILELSFSAPLEIEVRIAEKIANNSVWQISRNEYNYNYEKNTIPC